MKFILLILFTSIQIFALNIFLNSAKENGSAYAILHIIDDEPIECKTIPLPLDKKDYICMFNKTIGSKIKRKKLKLADIDFIEKKDKFYIKIDPKVSSRLISLQKPLYETENVNKSDQKQKAKHWAVLLYTKPPFGKNEHTEGINFPITYTKYKMPYIGSVDLNGAPISYAASEDINYYLEIQKEYNKKEYEDTIRDVDRTLNKYPNSIFKSDLLLYKLEAMDKLLEDKNFIIPKEYNNAEIAKLAKGWIRTFSSNENIPEVLYLLVKSYLRSNSSGDVNYFLDILITEHKNSPYTKKAILYFADSLYAKGKKEKAIKLYKDVLYSTTNLDIASLAAIRLTSTNIDKGKLKEARDYLTKVLDANKNYLLKDKMATQLLAEKLAENKLPKMAARLSDLLLENLGKDVNGQRELLLKESGDWHAKSGNIKEAYKRYQEYKKDYRVGNYIDEVNRSLDELFFKTQETNETKLLNYYNVLISKYNNYIKDKAVVEKAKLLMKQKKYNEVLDMKDILDRTVENNSSSPKNILDDAGYALIEKDIKNQNCNEAISILEKYNLDQNNITDKQNLFSCLMDTSRYQRANKLAGTVLKTSSFDQKFIWLQNYIDAKAKLQQFDEILPLEKDLFTLAKILKKNVSQATYVALFGTHYYLQQYDQALETLGTLSKIWPNNIHNIEPYYKMALYASSKRDDLLLIKYAKKIIGLQNKNRVFLHSPNIEFLLIDSLKRISKIKEALKEAKILNKRGGLSGNTKSRILYELGELSIKLNENKNAKAYFKECASGKTDNSWRSLCIDNLKLF
ncbi:MAG: tetratricopeptide repeat protein [Sulfurospirillaceae bacterium]|nr:tetratricopeptide repeat protein [Sulfurospirillaceae bacterium]